MRDEREIAVLSGLAQSLNRAADLLQQGEAPAWFLVVVRETGAPDVREYATRELCLDALRELQEEQLKNTDAPIYPLVFAGRQWKLTRTPAPGLQSGAEFVPLKPLRVSPNENGAVKSLVDIL